MIYLVAPVFNRVRFTLRLIEQLERQGTEYQLLLIDDGSTDDTANRARAALPNNLTVLTGNGRLWWAGALEMGLGYLKTQPMLDDDVMVILNHDIEFADDFLRTGATYVRADPNGLYGAREINRSDGKLVCAGVTIDWANWRFEFLPEPGRINTLSTRAVFLSWRVMRCLGGFHPHCLPHYLSDYEYTHRAWRMGHQLVVPTDLRVVVDDKATGLHQSDADIRLRDFFTTMLGKRSARNPIWFSSFIWLACPPAYRPKNLFRVWWAFGRHALGVAGHRLDPRRSPRG